MRGAYDLLGQKMINALTHLQHARGKNKVLMAIHTANHCVDARRLTG